MFCIFVGSSVLLEKVEAVSFTNFKTEVLYSQKCFANICALCAIIPRKPINHETSLNHRSWIPGSLSFASLFNDNGGKGEIT